MGNSFGHLFRITTWGESHGGAVGVVVDGCPPRLALSRDDLQVDAGPAAAGAEPHHHAAPGGRRLRNPLRRFRGADARHLDPHPGAQHRRQAAALRAVSSTSYRPSHADYAYDAKYGIRNWQGGGRASARETIGRVAAGAIAKKLLRERFGTEVIAYVKQVQHLQAEVDPETVTPEQVESNIARCPDAACAEAMIERIDWARRQGDSLGGVVEAVARGVPAGWGMPVFDKLEADLAKGLMSLPASKGFEIGSGFGGITLTGSAHNDAFEMRDGQIHTRTNHSGGVPGRHQHRRAAAHARCLQAHRHHRPRNRRP